jgi:nucleoside-diphosphate-sugar epimerase
LTYVEDTVTAFVMMATRKAAVGMVINIGMGTGVSVDDLVKLILRLTDRDARVVLDPQRRRPEMSEVLQLICDNQRAKAILGWEPTYTLEEGLLRVIDFVCAHSQLYREEVYAI